MGAIEDQFARGLENSLARASAMETQLLQAGKKTLEEDKEILEHPLSHKLDLLQLGMNGFFLVTDFVPFVTGLIGQEAAERIVIHAAPNHPHLATVAGLAGNLLGCLAGNKESWAKVIKVFGDKGAKAVVEDIAKALPENVRQEANQALEEAGLPRLTAEERAQVRREAPKRPEGLEVWTRYAKDTLEEVPEGPPGYADEPTYTPSGGREPPPGRRVLRNNDGKPIAVVKYFKRSDGTIEINSFVSDQGERNIGRQTRAINLLRTFAKDRVVAHPPYSKNTQRMLTALAVMKHIFTPEIKEDIAIGRRITFEASTEPIRKEIPVVRRTLKDLEDFKAAKEAERAAAPAAPAAAPAPSGVPQHEVPTAVHLARAVAEGAGFSPEQVQNIVNRVQAALGTSSESQVMEAVREQAEALRPRTQAELEAAGAIPQPPIELTPSSEVPPAVPPPPPPPSGGGGEPPSGGEPPEPPDDEEASKKRAATVAESFPHIPTTREVVNQVYRGARRELGAATNAEVNQKLAHGRGLWTGSKRIYSQFVNACLWAPHIWAAKGVTDLVFQPFEVGFRAAAVGVRFGPVAAAKTVEAALYGWRESIVDGLKYAAQSFEEDRPAFQMDKLNMGRGRVFLQEDLPNRADAYTTNNPLLGSAYKMLHAASVVNGGGRRVVLAEDQFAKALAERANMHMNAFIEGLYQAEGKGLSPGSKIRYAEMTAKWLVEHPTDALKVKTKQQMLEWTFSADGPIINEINRIANSSLVSRIGLPFVRVPGNMLRQGFAHSPGAFITEWSKFLKSDNAVDRLEIVAKWAVGTAFSYHFWNMAAKGELFGHGPQGQLKQFWPGKHTPESIKIGDSYFGHSHLGPFSTYLSLIADTATAYYMSKDENEAMRVLEAVTSGAAQQVGDSSFMRWVGNVMRVVDNARDQGTGKSLREYVGRELQGFIPGPARDYAEITDPGIPVTNVTGPGSYEMNPFLKDAEEMWRQFANGVPGWNKKRIHDLDVWGNEVYRPSGMKDGELATWWTRAANSMLPVEDYGKAAPDPVEHEFWTHQVSFDDNYTSVYGKDPQYQVPLTEDQQVEYHKLAGQGKFPGPLGTPADQHTAMEQMFNMDEYKHRNPGDQATAIHHLHEAYKKAARQAIIDKYNLMPAIEAAAARQHAPAQPSMEGPGGRGTPMPPMSITPLSTGPGTAFPGLPPSSSPDTSEDFSGEFNTPRSTP